VGLFRKSHAQRQAETEYDQQANYYLRCILAKEQWDIVAPRAVSWNLKSMECGQSSRTVALMHLCAFFQVDFKRNSAKDIEVSEYISRAMDAIDVEPYRREVMSLMQKDKRWTWNYDESPDEVIKASDQEEEFKKSLLDYFRKNISASEYADHMVRFFTDEPMQTMVRAALLKLIEEQP
jgi:hypothetical protein